MNHVDVVHFIKWLTDFMEKVQCSFCHGQSGFRAGGRNAPFKRKKQNITQQRKVLLQLYVNTVAVVLVAAVVIIVVSGERHGGQTISHSLDDGI